VTASLDIADRIEQRLRSLRGDPVGFCREVLDLEPHAGQSQWLTHANKSENALVTGNRYGKSQIAGARRIYRALYKIGWSPEIDASMRRKHAYYRSVNVAITADQARLVWSKAYGMLQGDKASWLVKDVKFTPFPCIELITGATIEARSTAREGVYLLGHDYDDVNFDEAAYEPHFLRVRDNVIRMRLVDRAGTLDYTSTGNGRNDFGQYFLDGLDGKEPDLYTQTGTSYDNPHIDADRLKLNAGRMSDKMRAQNIEGSIIDLGGGYFNLGDIDAALCSSMNDDLVIQRDDEDLEKSVVAYSDGKPWYERFPGHRYLHGWDLADKQDYMVGTTWDLSTTPRKMVEFERFTKRGWDFNWSRIRARHHRYKTFKATKIDATGIGDVATDELKDIKAEGVNFSGKKDALLTNLQTALSLREIQWPFIKVLIDEFKFYDRDDAQLQTDCVMSAAVAMWFARKPERGLYVGSAW
jgi:hypothetical protein